VGEYIYVASSWRNPWQPTVVELLRDADLAVYDFRHPAPGDEGFRWTDVDPEWKAWQPERYREALAHPIAEHGFGLDMDALENCTACLLVQPCGTSSHLELGWAVGAGKRTAVLFPTDLEAQPVGGHSVSSAPCRACGDLDGCHLPARVRRVEPELMAKMADTILIGRRELSEWVAELTNAS